MLLSSPCCSGCMLQPSRGGVTGLCGARALCCLVCVQCCRRLSLSCRRWALVWCSTTQRLPQASLRSPCHQVRTALSTSCQHTCCCWCQAACHAEKLQATLHAADAQLGCAEPHSLPPAQQSNTASCAVLCCVLCCADSALLAADKLLFAREVIASIVSSHGLAVTWLPKPMAGHAGSGCHLHFSLWRVSLPDCWSACGWGWAVAVVVVLVDCMPMLTRTQPFYAVFACVVVCRVVTV